MNSAGRERYPYMPWGQTGPHVYHPLASKSYNFFPEDLLFVFKSRTPASM